MYAADLVSVLANKSTWSSFRKPFFAAALVTDIQLVIAKVEVAKVEVVKLL